MDVAKISERRNVSEILNILRMQIHVSWRVLCHVLCHCVMKRLLLIHSKEIFNYYFYFLLFLKTYGQKTLLLKFLINTSDTYIRSGKANLSRKFVIGSGSTFIICSLLCSGCNISNIFIAVLKKKKKNSFYTRGIIRHASVILFSAFKLHQSYLHTEIKFCDQMYNNA